MPALDLTGKQIVLLLQGGGALGAYQVGAFKALAEQTKAKGCQINWVSGISIGAINSSVIAGHRNPDAVAELESLWDDILSPAYPPSDCGELLQAMRFFVPNMAHYSLLPKYAGWNWTAFNLGGQPNFFTSRVMDPLRNPWMLQWAGDLERDQLAFYDTSPLRNTLEKHVDFASLKKPGATRLSLAAARVCDGEVEFFDSGDSKQPPLTADHVMASGALPPAFPPIQIEDEWYFDGGVSNNTPIEMLQEKIFAEKQHTLVFVVDVWDRKSEKMPANMDELIWRQKSIQYGSRKKAAENVVRLHEYMARAGRDTTRLEVCQVMLENTAGDSDFCFGDANFLRSNYESLSKKGYQDMNSAIRDADLVTPVQYQFSALYRYGSAHKHRETDDASDMMLVPLFAPASPGLASASTTPAQVPSASPPRPGIPSNSPPKAAVRPSFSSHSTTAEASSTVQGPKPEVPALVGKS